MEPQAPPELDLRRYIDIARRRKAIIGLVVVATVGLTVLFSARQAAVYEASSRVLLQPTSAQEILGVESGSGRSGDGVATEIQVMQSEAVEQAVRAELGRLPDVSFETVSDTNVVKIVATAGTGEAAAEGANGYANGYIVWRREATTARLSERSEQLRQQADGLNDQLLVAEAPLRQIDEQLAIVPPPLPGEPPSGDRQFLLDERARVESETAEERNSLQARILSNQQELDQVQQALTLLSAGGSEVLTPATPPGSPVSPQPLRNAMLALVVGLVAGVVLALVLEMLDDRIRRKEDLVDAAGGRSALGLIPVVAGRRRRRRGERDDPVVVSRTAPNSPAAEAYRTLRTSLQFLAVDDPVQFIQVTSPNSKEGKTTTVANMGVGMARAGQRVVVVCCDLRRPRVHEFYGLDNSVGFTSVMLGDATLDEALQPVPDEPRLWLLASGPPPPNPAELLSARRTEEVLARLADVADVVIIDTPPVLPVTDGLLVSSLVDITILVAKAGTTNKRAARRAVELLDQVDANLVGCVLNGAPTGGAYGYGGADGYGYGYQAYGAAPSRSDRRRASRGRGGSTMARDAG